MATMAFEFDENATYPYHHRFTRTKNSNSRISILREVLESLDDLSKDEKQLLITDALSDSSHLVRQLAQETIEKFGIEAAFAAITSALTNENPNIRAGGIYALGGFDHPDIPGLLFTASKDPDPIVRQAPGDIVDSLSTPKQIEVFAYQLHSPYPDLKYDALLRLKAIGTPDAIAVIKQGRHDPDPDFQMEVDNVLADLEYQ